MAFKSEIRNYRKFDKKKHLLVLVGFLDEIEHPKSSISGVLKTRTKGNIPYIQINSFDVVDYFHDFGFNKLKKEMKNRTPYLIVSDMHTGFFQSNWRDYIDRGWKKKDLTYVSVKKLNKLSEKLDCNLLYGERNFLEKLIINNKKVNKGEYSLNEFMPYIENNLMVN